MHRVEGYSANKIDSGPVAGNDGTRIGYIVGREISIVCPQTKKILVCDCDDVRLRINGDVGKYREPVSHLTKRCEIAVQLREEKKNCWTGQQEQGDNEEFADSHGGAIIAAKRR